MCALCNSLQAAVIFIKRGCEAVVIQLLCKLKRRVRLHVFNVPDYNADAL